MPLLQVLKRNPLASVPHIAPFGCVRLVRVEIFLDVERRPLKRSHLASTRNGVKLLANIGYCYFEPLIHTGKSNTKGANVLKPSCDFCLFLAKLSLLWEGCPCPIVVLF